MAEREHPLKDALKHSMANMIDDLKEDDLEWLASPEISPEERARLLMARSVPYLGLPRFTMVDCAMPNNLKNIRLVDAIQCTGCGEYFCKDHNLHMNKCPLCQANL
jgi:hypothetical protein